MTLDSIPPEGRIRPGAGHLGTAATQGARNTGADRPSVSGSPRPAPPAVDQAELSPDVRELAAAEEIPSGTIPPERLKEILGRIAQGGHDQPEVLDATAEGVLRDLRSHSPEE